MSRPDRVSRRQLLATGLVTLGGLVANRLRAFAAPSDCATPTPEQTEGPFYPENRRGEEDADLVHVKGRSGRAHGQVVQVRGRILDPDCQPVKGAVVEIWQANHWGRYDHERDADNPRRIDASFQGRARIVTGADGRYVFTTIKPGAYPGDDSGWMRPPHIHFKVSRRGFHELTTQMYFAGEALNDPDRVRADLSPEERSAVTVAFEPAPKIERGAVLGQFDLTLRRLG